MNFSRTLINIFRSPALWPLVLGLSIIASGCFSRTTPIEFAPGEHQCTYCMMGISDLRFRGEILSPKGKTYFFDSLECLASWSQDNPELIDSSWVSSFFTPKTWIRLSEAIVVHSPKLNSPMGAGLSAYQTQTEAAEAIRLFEGDTLDSSGLNRFVTNWRKKTVQHHVHSHSPKLSPPIKGN